MEGEASDFSRPYFPRNAGEVGLYVDVDEVQSTDAHAYGSDRILRINVTEKLGQRLSTCDLVKVKGELEQKGHFHGIILEEFRRGTILALTFNDMAALVALWKLHERKQLSPLFQSLLVDGAMMEELGVCKLTLRVRTFLDELEACRDEIRKMAKENLRVDIKSRSRDIATLQRMRQFQKEQSDSLLQQLRDAETYLDSHLSEFLLLAKQHLPEDMSTLPCLQVFQQYVSSSAAVTKPTDFKPVQHFFSALDLLRTTLAQAEVNIYLPLTSIPARCETEHQRGLKKQMEQTCKELARMLDPCFDLKNVSHKEWESKVLPRERSMFMGLVSIVPLGVEKITDVDEFLDEYMSGFPSVL